MSQYNINPRCLPSTPPPSMTGNPNFNGHSPFQASGSRPQSVVSSRSYPGIESALERTNNGNPRVDASSIIPVVHNYCAWMGNVMVEFIIRIVTPKDSRDSAVTLTCQAGGVERIMGEPQIVQLDTNPTQANFIIYVIPRESIPLNSLFKFRVWLSSPEFQVRLWAEDEFWIGAQLPFPSIPGAHLARLTHASPLFHTYHGTVGAASLVYTVCIDRVPYAPTRDEYLITLRYSAGGIGRELCSNIRLRLSCSLEEISFIIYSIRQNSEPKKGRHKFRLWVRSANGGICQRLWAGDDLCMGKDLEFQAVQQGTVIFAQRGTVTSSTARADPFSEPSDLPAYSPNPLADEYQ
ncbi:unnamed protein product [Rhizoctonia solani]|uniref:Uncharacterized protein n=2 Tax=Rhizoctonia solani TaxID=456999 RepID=A0A8H3GQU8_9AGAM|nr:uncharacterized protein RhiXN_03864 [Rhizoctonia solani]QRW15863.1 hypothetical protein RhiXN_03864 [Rhizoctonia solani]CAE6461474.1 unnamed protein product [Rhizoctonia solani]